MKNTYVQFYSANLADIITPALGSDSIMYIDGRWSIATIDWNASERARKLKHVGCDFTGYAVFRIIDERFSNSIVKGYKSFLPTKETRKIELF